MPDKSATIFISSGELSGEMHGAYLVGAIQELRAEQGKPPAIFEGNGSQRMAAAGVQLLHDVSTWGEMGIVANAAKLQYLHRALKETLAYIISNQPDMVILVDNRVFNLNLARLLKGRSYTGSIVYYVSPVHWQALYDQGALKKSLTNRRFLDIKQYCDFAIPIYPVSLDTYKALGIPHEFPGHPLCEVAKPRLTDAEFATVSGIDITEGNTIIVGAMPGSRVGEVKQIAPVIFQALSLMCEAFCEDPKLPELKPVAMLAHHELLDEVLNAARRAGLGDLTLIGQEHVYDLMARSQLIIAKSGTAVHECMLMNVPAVMCYKVTPLSAWFARRILRFKMPYYSLPNLLAGRPVVPELIQEDCDHRRIVDLAGSLLFEEQERENMLSAFSELRELACKPRPLRRAAELVVERLPC